MNRRLLPFLVSRIPLNLVHPEIAPNLYLYSDGTVRQCSGGLFGGQVTLTPRLSKQDRPYVLLPQTGGSTYALWIDIEVYRAFVGPIPKGHRVITRDGNPLNCHVKNLYMLSENEYQLERIRRLGEHFSSKKPAPKEV